QLQPMDSVLGEDTNTTMPDCPVAQSANLLDNRKFDEIDVKEEIKEEPYDDYDYNNYPSSSRSYIYDPEDVKIEEEDDCHQTMEGNSAPTFIQPLSSAQYGVLLKKEEESDQSDYPSTSTKFTVSRTTAVTRVVTPVINCSICGQIFKFRFQVAKHIREEHSDHVNQKRETALPPTRVHLQDAKKVQSWRGHTKLDGCFYVEKFTIEGKGNESGTTITYLDCGVCGERFANARDHRIHAIRIHPGNKDERMCKNEYCVRMRATHEKTHPGTAHMSGQLRVRLSPMFDPVNCPICGARQESYFQLYPHFVEKHTMEYLLRYKCKGCNRTFTSPRGLQNHILKESERFGRSCVGATIPMPARRRQRQIPSDNRSYLLSNFDCLLE
ncbi:hypothetical protein PMAYCL1PPCAC_30744, partial [Pristionchus mayeri]